MQSRLMASGEDICNLGEMLCEHPSCPMIRFVVTMCNSEMNHVWTGASWQRCMVFSSLDCDEAHKGACVKRFPLEAIQTLLRA